MWNEATLLLEQGIAGEFTLWKHSGILISSLIV